MPDDTSVAVFSINQATRASFPDLYFNRSVLFFIQRGSKFVQTSAQGGIVGEKGDLMVFPHGAMVTMENRPQMNEGYCAVGLSLGQELVDAVYEGMPTRHAARQMQLLRADPHRPENMLALLRDTLENHKLPPEIRAHRLREPLIWLRSRGIALPTHIVHDAASKLRVLFEGDLSHSWRAEEGAAHLAMSPATLRRRLASTGHSFSKLLIQTRLEHGLLRLQTGEEQISEIALACGFKTPSHFSDAFRKRFAIRPIDIRLATD